MGVAPTIRGVPNIGRSSNSSIRMPCYAGGMPNWFTNFVRENIWSVTVPVSVVCLLLAWLFRGISGLGVTLLIFSACTAFAGAVIVLVKAIRGVDAGPPMRLHHLFLNCLWAVVFGGLFMTGQLAPVLQSGAIENYSGADGATIVRGVGYTLQEEWEESGRNLLNVDTDSMLAEMHPDAFKIVRIEVTRHDEAIIHVRESGQGYRFHITDIEDMDGEWLKPLPWDEQSRPGAEREGEPIIIE